MVSNITYDLVSVSIEKEGGKKIANSIISSESIKKEVMHHQVKVQLDSHYHVLIVLSIVKTQYLIRTVSGSSAT